MAGGRTRVLLRCNQVAPAQTEMGSGHTHVQSPDPPSRPGALHADPGGRQPRGHRPSVHADLTERADSDGTVSCTISKPRFCAGCGTSRISTATSGAVQSCTRPFFARRLSFG